MQKKTNINLNGEKDRSVSTVISLHWNSASVNRYMKMFCCSKLMTPSSRCCQSSFRTADQLWALPCVLMELFFTCGNFG